MRTKYLGSVVIDLQPGHYRETIRADLFGLVTIDHWWGSL